MHLALDAAERLGNAALSQVHVLYHVCSFKPFYWTWVLYVVEWRRNCGWTDKCIMNMNNFHYIRHPHPNIIIQWHYISYLCELAESILVYNSTLHSFVCAYLNACKGYLHLQQYCLLFQCSTTSLLSLPSSYSCLHSTAQHIAAVLSSEKHFVSFHFIRMHELSKVVNKDQTSLTCIGNVPIR